MHMPKKTEVKVMQFDKTPDYIVGEMRDYQLQGLNWLITLYENGINGILGDEMGLGMIDICWLFLWFFPAKFLIHLNSQVKPFRPFRYWVTSSMSSEYCDFIRSQCQWSHFLASFKLNLDFNSIDFAKNQVTVQTIQCCFNFCRKINGPFLVIAPLSTLQNWMNEVERFCPSLRAFKLYARKPDKTKLLKKLENPKEWDVCITSYEIALLHDVHKFRKLNWEYIALDEGHKIKNEQTKMNGAANMLKSEHRLLLTGTPLQVSCNQNVLVVESGEWG